MKDPTGKRLSVRGGIVYVGVWAQLTLPHIPLTGVSFSELMKDL
jgi:hypothetical protein